jgi:hypothetical protein
MGLVNGGADNTKTFTGWRLRIVEAEIRSISFLVLHIPLVISKSLLIFYIKTVAMQMFKHTGRLRNIQDDPFAVRGNRETVGELL